MSTIEKRLKIFGLHDRDILHHVVLAFAMFCGIIGILTASSRSGKFIIGCLMAVFYVAWSIVHHKLDGDLYGKNVVEYVLIAFLSIVLLAGVLL